jgi:hypothetical protein
MSMLNFLKSRKDKEKGNQPDLELKEGITPGLVRTRID